MANDVNMADDANITNMVNMVNEVNDVTVFTESPCSLMSIKSLTHPEDDHA